MEQQQQQQTAGLLAAILSKAERPSMFSRREGSLLRLVPANERLTNAQLRQQLVNLLAQLHMQQQLSEQLLACQHHKRPARHVVAWLRGCCYLAAGNSRQALRDARTAMAYATAAAADNIPASGPVRPAPQGPAAEEHTDNTATGPTPAAAAAQGAGQSCGWFPALLLAGQAYADLDDHAQAVLHLAKAELVAPPCAASVVSSALHQAVHGLSADEGYAWATGGLQGLAQQLQLEADLKLPEVLRPRPKWYYYNQWMKQRIHLTLLELHLGSIMPPAHQSTQHLLSSSSSSSGGGGGGSSSNDVPAETSISSARGRLLLSLLAEGGNEAPVVAAAAAAAGFQAGKPTAPALALPAAAAAAAAASKADTAAVDAAMPPTGHAYNSHTDIAELPFCLDHTSSNSCSRSSSSSSSSRNSSGGLLQLPEPVVSKLLAMDAGDLDLMAQHPVALQGQVYELLDVLQTQGPEALQHYPIQPLTWEEVQGLAGPGVVGLPLGYTPAAALLPPTAGVKALPMPEGPTAGMSHADDSKPVEAAAATAAVTALLAGPVTGPVGEMVEAAAEAAADVADTDKGLVAADVGLHVSSSDVRCDCVAQEATQQHVASWRKPGWTRAQYVREAVAAAQRAG